MAYVAVDFQKKSSAPSSPCTRWEEEGIYALSATNGEERAVMIVNDTEEDREICTNLDPAFRLSLVDEEHFLTEVDASPARFVLRAHQVALWKSGV